VAGLLLPSRRKLEELRNAEPAASAAPAAQVEQAVSPAS
jgi:hypothetical protein